MLTGMTMSGKLLMKMTKSTGPRKPLKNTFMSKCCLQNLLYSHFLASANQENLSLICTNTLDQQQQKDQSNRILTWEVDDGGGGWWDQMGTAPTLTLKVSRLGAVTVVSEREKKKKAIHWAYRTNWRTSTNWTNQILQVHSNPYLSIQNSEDMKWTTHISCIYIYMQKS